MLAKVLEKSEAFLFSMSLGEKAERMNSRWRRSLDTVKAEPVGKKLMTPNSGLFLIEGS